MSQTKTFVDLQGVTKAFGILNVVHETNLGIGRGEFFSLLGPSGCGKTTLLRMLGGFAPPTSGRILIDGNDVTDLPAAKRPTNMVFQSYAIFPHLNVIENISFGLAKEPIDKETKRRRVDEALNLVKLSGFETRRPDQLSGGQRQRVALARAIVKRPKVLLLDEPLSALDKKLREEMQVELRGIQRESQTTFVFVTHDQQEALAMSDRIAVMNAGRIAQVGTPYEIYRNPESRFVAEFVGSMNFFEGVVLESTEKSAEIDICGLGRTNCTVNAAFQKRQRVSIGIRPENMALSTNEEPGSLRGEQIGMTYLGDKTLRLVRLPDVDKPVMVSVASCSELQSFETMPVWLGFSPTGIRVFPSAR